MDIGVGRFDAYQNQIINPEFKIIKGDKKMRQLITNDIFKMSRILKKLEIKIIANGTDAQFMTDLIVKVAENAYIAQDEINDFIGSLAGMTAEEFGNLPIKESIEIVKDFKSLDGVSDFFKLAGL